MKKRILVTAALVVSLSALADTAGSETADGRINLWPVFYSDPPDSMGCFPLFYRNRGEFISLPVCWGPKYATVPLTLSWYARSAGDCEDYVGLLGLFDMRLSKSAYARSWLFPLYYHDSNLFLSPVLAWGEESFGVPAALSWRTRHGGDTSYCGLMGLGGLNLGEDGYTSSWLFPLYYHNANLFISPIVGWNDTTFGIPAALSWYRKKGASETYCGLLGLTGLQFDGGDYGSSWLLPLYYHDNSGACLSILYCQARGTRFSPVLLSGRSEDELGNVDWASVPLLSAVRTHRGDLRSVDVGLGLLFSASYDADGCTNCSAVAQLMRYCRDPAKDDSRLEAFLLAGYETHGGRYAESHLVPFYAHETNEKFLSLPYSWWRGGQDRTHELYGLMAYRGYGIDYFRFNILWKFFDYERDGIATRIDCFPGITYDMTDDGTFDVSFWYRFFRYRSTPNGMSDLSIFFIPFK